jgi:hypothetical protein
METYTTYQIHYDHAVKGSYQRTVQYENLLTLIDYCRQIITTEDNIHVAKIRQLKDNDGKIISNTKEIRKIISLQELRNIIESINKLTQETAETADLKKNKYGVPFIEIPNKHLNNNKTYVLLIDKWNKNGKELPYFQVKQKRYINDLSEGYSGCTCIEGNKGINRILKQYFNCKFNEYTTAIETLI